MFRARENKKINDKERAAVVSFIQAGWSLNRIAQEVGCAKEMSFCGKNDSMKQVMFRGNVVLGDREQHLQPKMLPSMML